MWPIGFIFRNLGFSMWLIVWPVSVKCLWRVSSLFVRHKFLYTLIKSFVSVVQLEMIWPQGTLAFNVHKHSWSSPRGRGAATGVRCSRAQGRCQHAQCPGQLPNEWSGPETGPGWEARSTPSSLTLLMNSYSRYSPNGYNCQLLFLSTFISRISTICF